MEAYLKVKNKKKGGDLVSTNKNNYNIINSFTWIYATTSSQDILNLTS